MLLALDTSGDIAVSLLALDGDAPGPVLAARRASEQRRHAELLAPMVTDVLADADADRGDVTAVVVGTGPAPFTGLRAGLVTARVLARALRVPVHGVPSLDALAHQAFAAGLAPDGEVLVVTDARRREVYAARYRAAGDGTADVVTLAGPLVDRPDAVAAALADGAVVVGPGTALYPDVLAAADAAPTVLDPAALAVLAATRAARGEDLPTEPLYLRRPDVTPAPGRKRVTG